MMRALRNGVFRFDLLFIVLAFLLHRLATKLLDSICLMMATSLPVHELDMGRGALSDSLSSSPDDFAMITKF